LDHPKEGPLLMGQRRGSEGLPVGPIYKFVWQKKSFEKGPKIPLPKETNVDPNIFSIALAAIRDKDKLDLIMLDDLEHLRVVGPDGKKVWGGRESYGASNNFYDTTKKKEMVYRPGEAPPWRVFIPGRIVIKDLDRDGILGVIVNKNMTSTTRMFDRIRSFDKGEIYNLVWDENTLVTSWKTREINGYITDFQVKDADNDGEEELVVAIIPQEEGIIEGIFSKKTRSNILFFKLF